MHEQPQSTRRQILRATAGGLAAGRVVQTADAQTTARTVYVGTGAGDSNLYALNAETGEQEWAFTRPSGGVDSSPTVADGTVYVGAGGTDESGDPVGRLYAVDASTGRQEWVFGRSSGRVRSSPTVVGGTVYTFFTDGTLYAVDAATGTEQWVAATPSEFVQSSPTVADGTVYVGADGLGSREDVYAVDTETGEREWTLSRESFATESSPTVVDGTVYVAGDVDGTGENAGATLLAVDAATGAEEWVFRDPFSDRMPSSPTVSNGTVYVGAGSTTAGFSNPLPRQGAVTLHAVDADTGRQNWEANSLPYNMRSSPTVADGTVYVCSGPELHAIDTAAGELAWVFTDLFETTRNFAESSPTVADGTVYVGGRGVYALAAATGTEQWVFETDATVRSSPTVVANPTSGDSVGSRVRLGTLGHHGNWQYAGQRVRVDDGTASNGTDNRSNGAAGDENGSDGSGPGFGVGGALAGLAGAGYLLRRLDASTREN